MQSRWLLLYNCQANGLGNCLNLMCDEIAVEHFDPTGYARERERLASELRAFDRIFVAPQFQGLGNALEPVADRVASLPTVFFNGYHPDVCYVNSGPRPLRGPLGEYHSIIAYASYVAGLSEEEACSQFRERTYERLGYPGRWEKSWRRLLASFNRHGFDLSPRRAAWSRAGVFMYTVNHPRIHCLRDVAAMVLEREGRKARYLDVLPPDNLANGPVIPVYPGLASRLGCEGSRLFKRPGAYRHFPLEAFVAESYAAYRAAPGHRIRDDYAEMFEIANQALGEAA